MGNTERTEVALACLIRLDGRRTPKEGHVCKWLTKTIANLAGFFRLAWKVDRSSSAVAGDFAAQRY